MKLTTHFLKQLIREAIDEAHCNKRDDDNLKQEEKGDETSGDEEEKKEKKELTPKQKKNLDVAPPPGVINAADFEKLRDEA